MELKKTACSVAIACSFVALAVTNAAAQAPVLTVAVSGQTMTIEWTPVPGALGYELQAGTIPGSPNIGSAPLPANITRVVVVLPNGTYYLRVRATAGSILGPFSNEVGVTVGAPPCTAPPAAPNATATPRGATVLITWQAVAGALAYRIEFSRFPGGTELAVTSSSNSVSQWIGALGTYYARVVAGNQCGETASREVAFSITDLASGPGPRAANPSPGQLLPLPGYGESVMYQVAAQFAGDLANACNSRTYLYRLAQALRQRDSRWGLNYKRGHRGSLSTDIITYNPTDRADEGESRVYLVDVVSAICEGNLPWWGDVTHETWGARGDPACGTEWCAMWTIEPYLAAGFPPDPRQQQ